jgi:hypothetical protein
VPAGRWLAGLAGTGRARQQRTRRAVPDVRAKLAGHGSPPHRLTWSNVMLSADNPAGEPKPM